MITYNFEQLYIKKYQFIMCNVSNTYYSQNNMERRELKSILFFFIYASVRLNLNKSPNQIKRLYSAAFSCVDIVKLKFATAKQTHVDDVTAHIMTRCV